MSFVVEQQPLPTSPLGRELINDPSALESNVLGHLTARRLLRWDHDCRAGSDLQRVEQSGEVLGNRTTQLPFQKKLRSGGGHAEICRAWRTGYNRCLRVSKAFMQSGCEVTRSRGGRPGWTFHRPGCWRRISGHRGSYGEITNREPLTWIGESFSGRLGLRESPAE